MEQTGIWTEELEVRASMVDMTRRATLPAICNFLQEVAGNHANFRKIGFYEMLEKDRFWALTRLRIRMSAFPGWQDRIRISTWVHSMKGPFSIRNFEIGSVGGVLLGTASTLWTAVDATKRRPVRIDITDLPILEDRLPLCGEPEKIEEYTLTEPPASYRVRYSDTDMVRHVNNVQYIIWVLDSYENRSEQLFPLELDVNYFGETHLGDEVEIYCRQLSKGEYVHSIFRKEEEKEVTRMRMKWGVISTITTPSPPPPSRH